MKLGCLEYTDNNSDSICATLSITAPTSSRRQFRHSLAPSLKNHFSRTYTFDNLAISAVAISRIAITAYIYVIASDLLSRCLA